MENITINAHLVFEIKSKTHWINKFPGAIPELPMSEKYLWVDANGNTTTKGEDFSAAEEFNAYPIKIYHLQRSAHLRESNSEYVLKLKKHLGI